MRPQNAAAEVKKGLRLGPRPGAPSNWVRLRTGGLEILRWLNEIGWLIHHGKSIENCLLLLDLSRFLKL
jgi:hypothetical protein